MAESILQHGLLWSSLLHPVPLLGMATCTVIWWYHILAITACEMLVSSTALMQESECAEHKFLKGRLPISGLCKVVLKLSVVELSVLIFLFKGFQTDL